MDRTAVEAIGLEVEIIDASGCVITPGLSIRTNTFTAAAAKKDSAPKRQRFGSTRS